jgi:hypothetical protein
MVHPGDIHLRTSFCSSPYRWFLIIPDYKGRFNLLLSENLILPLVLPLLPFFVPSFPASPENFPNTINFLKIKFLSNPISHNNSR